MVSYDYDPGGQRVTRTRLGVTTVCLGGGVVEEDMTGATRTAHTNNAGGRIGKGIGRVFLCTGCFGGLCFPHEDHNVEIR